MYFFVYATYVFYCFLYGIVWVLNITKYNSDFNCNESKYCILELKMGVLAQEAIFRTFCTQIQKIVKFWADVRLHNVA